MQQEIGALKPCFCWVEVEIHDPAVVSTDNVETMKIFVSGEAGISKPHLAIFDTTPPKMLGYLIAW